MGRRRADKNKPYSIYIVSSKETMMYILKRINGLIRLKIPGFKEACILYNLDYIEANYNIALYDPNFAGLVDRDGSIVFNYAGNRIECNLEFKYNEYTSKLNFDNTILHSKPFIIKRAKSSKSGGPKDYISIAFKFQSIILRCKILFPGGESRRVGGFPDGNPGGDRVMKIKSFFEIRKYKTSPKHSLEHRIYSNFFLVIIIAGKETVHNLYEPKILSDLNP
ncbi:hypothetical protein OnM2_066032 [Erysiphe neolycopersici]|uniref:Homing endonuclease LAGLIDADG domain-containing protein n=1 Tax=Erysiphe neolycopersici TaxID=212602 RepID=A0A420HML7_9PEZI|nr:hypothetical protein OnM2_066032 [Erysiphe neolycopersici]